jgi:hypothetical protein
MSRAGRRGPPPPTCPWRRVAGRVDLDAVLAGDPLQVGLVLRFEPRLPDDRACGDALVERLAELAGGAFGRRRDLPDLAEQDRPDVALGVVADRNLVFDDSGVVTLALRQIGELLGADEADRGRRVSGRHGAALDLCAHLLPAQSQDVREPLVELFAKRALGRQLVLDDRDLDRVAVGGEDAAVGGEDVAARRRHRDRLHDVGGRPLRVLGTGQHLQVPQAEGDDPKERKRYDPEHSDPARQLRGERRAALERGLDHGRESGLRPPVV